MKIGLLWYDDDPEKSLEEKVERAARRYYEKFGVKPNMCYVNPSAMASKKTKHKRVTIKATPTVLPDHFWIGLADR